MVKGSYQINPEMAKGEDLLSLVFHLATFLVNDLLCCLVIVEKVLQENQDAFQDVEENLASIT